MYFEQQNFFTSMDQSNQDLKKMMDLSQSNDQNIFQNRHNINLNQDSNNEQNLEYSSFAQQNKQAAIQSQNQEQQKQSESSSLIKNGYSKYESQIKSLLPEIHSHLIQKHYNRFQRDYQTKLEKYRNQISKKYQQRVQAKIDQIKENINNNLTNKFQRISKLKQQITNIKKYYKDSKLSFQQQQELVQKTVNEIFNSDKLLNQIKQKLHPKVQDRVRFILIRDLQKELNKCQNQIEDKIAQERDQFKLKRKVHWEQQAQNQLKDLAVQFQQLKQKKSTMEQIVKQKITEKQSLIKKHKQLTQKCKEIKQLQKNIKDIQQKLSKTSNKRKINQKSLDNKSKRRA